NERHSISIFCVRVQENKMQSRSIRYFFSVYRITRNVLHRESAFRTDSRRHYPCARQLRHLQSERDYLSMLYDGQKMPRFRLVDVRNVVLMESKRIFRPTW